MQTLSPKVLQSTILVSASNSSAKHKRLAKYVCDGTNDHVEIQAAIDEAISGALWENTGEVLADKTYASVWKDGSTYYMYYHNGADGGVRSIGLATSSDGIEWADQGVVLDATGTETGVGVPNVWKESSTWYMLYASYGTTNTICLATSSDGISWTRSASNPVISPDADDSAGGLLEGTGIIKVGSTYYLYFNASREAYGTRYITYATSTNLTSWTKNTTPPLFQSYSFCPEVFKCDNYYYMMVCHRTTMSADTGRSGIELWRATLPTFVDKTFVGMMAAAVDGVLKWDTPSIITSDITRTIAPSDPAEVFGAAKYSGNWGTSRIYESNISEAITRSRTLGRIDVRVLPGAYSVLTSGIYINGPIRLDLTGAHIVATHVTGTYMVSVGSPHSSLIGGNLEMIIASGHGNALLIMSDSAEIDTHIIRGVAYIHGTCNTIRLVCDYGYPFLTFGARCNDVYAIARYGTYNVLFTVGAIDNTVLIHGKSATTAPIGFATGASYNVVRGSIVPLTTDFATFDSTSVGNVIENLMLPVSSTQKISNAGTLNLVKNCYGYIAPGEIKTISGSIATLTQDAFNSLDNPFGRNVALLALDVYVSTGATATLPNIDCGIGSSATTDYANLFDDLPGETIGLYNSKIATPGAQTQPILWQSGAGNRYLNMSIKDAAATGMVATYVATVMGL